MEVFGNHMQSTLALQVGAEPKPVTENEFLLMALCVLHLRNSEWWGNRDQQLVKLSISYIQWSKPIIAFSPRFVSHVQPLPCPGSSSPVMDESVGSSSPSPVQPGLRTKVFLLSPLSSHGNN